jgi:hypothetical protein
MAFVVLKSYDGGKRWERALKYNDFGSATKAAMALEAQHTAIRFRVDVEPMRLRQAKREAMRPKRRQR